MMAPRFLPSLQRRGMGWVANERAQCPRESSFSGIEPLQSRPPPHPPPRGGGGGEAGRPRGGGCRARRAAAAAIALE